MGDMVDIPGPGGTGSGGGYLATAPEGAGIGVVVIQEWWGLVPHIVEVCDRLAKDGFTAVAPDLYHSHTVAPGEPDEARKAAMTLDLPRAALDMSGAVDFLRNHSAVRGDGVGVVGFCMGGGLALWLATLRPDAVRAVVPFYGIVAHGAAGPEGGPDWSAMTAAVEGHYAEHDHSAGPEAVAAFEARLRDLGKDVRLFSYPGTHHAFFNDTRPKSYDGEAARQAWVRTLEFLRAKLG